MSLPSCVGGAASSAVAASVLGVTEGERMGSRTMPVSPVVAVSASALALASVLVEASLSVFRTSSSLGSGSGEEHGEDEDDEEEDAVLRVVVILRCCGSCEALVAVRAW